MDWVWVWLGGGRGDSRLVLVYFKETPGGGGAPLPPGRSRSEELAMGAPYECQRNTRRNSAP